MYIKIMTGAFGVPDSDSRATFRILEGTDVEFERDKANGLAMVRVDEYWYDMDDANAYVMNEAGKTVAHFGAALPLEYMDLDAAAREAWPPEGRKTAQQQFVEEHRPHVVDEVLRDNFVASHLCQGPNGSTPVLPHAVLPETYHEAYKDVASVGFIAPTATVDEAEEYVPMAPCGGRTGNSDVLGRPLGIPAGQ